MADPISLALMAGIGGYAIASGSKSQPTMPTTNPTAGSPPPDQSQPATVPGSKPAPKTSQQQSFLSGAAALRDGGGTTGSSSGGSKTLLGQ